jgi:hypothetical protein
MGMTRGIYIWLLITMLPFAGIAQPSLTVEAYNAYQSQNLSQAKSLIDQASGSASGKNDAMTWHIKGFIYKDIYIKEDQRNRKSVHREVAVESFKQSIALDKKEEYLDNNKKSIQFLASSFYNDAVLLIRETNATTILESEALYKKYKAVHKITEPNEDFKERDIAYYKALATGNRKVYEADRENNKDFLLKSLENYSHVLQLDPNDYGANYNMAINLYNEGAHNIEGLDNEAQIPAIVKVQAVSVELFKEALPYMLKAHELNPEREETLKGLRGIYLSLNNEEEANKYRDLLRDRQQTKNR